VYGSLFDGGNQTSVTDFMRTLSRNCGILSLSVIIFCCCNGVSSQLECVLEYDNIGKEVAVII